jgi:hypothetical protein
MVDDRRLLWGIADVAVDQALLPKRCAFRQGAAGRWWDNPSQAEAIVAPEGHGSRGWLAA